MERIKQLSDLQLAVMDVLWQHGEATVAQVHASLQEERNLAPTTVGTILARLEKYGIVTHYTEGRQSVYRSSDCSLVAVSARTHYTKGRKYVYYPLVSRREVRRLQVSELLDQFFQGNPADLVCHLIDEEEVDGEDLERIMSLIESKEKERERQNDNR